MPTYDHTLRRDTPLARKLIARIRESGPLSVHDYMDACLNDKEHGYYRKQQAIGRAGDFITAPEISQIFGELIGLWCAVVWQQMGRPQRLDLVELGAGRGTLLADALRAARAVPDFLSALSVHILEQNEALMAAQRRALARSSVDIAWVESLDRLPVAAPAIWIGNEFLDTIPVRQGWIDGAMTEARRIGVDENGALQFLPRSPHFSDAGFREWQDFSALADALVARTNAAPRVALFLDYGHRARSDCDTLQAVRRHSYEHALTSPGEADLSVQVAFDDIADALRGTNQVNINGPVSQAEFLGRLGIVERASRLMAGNPGRANEIETAVARLMAPQGMGSRFLAIGARSHGLPPLPGFADA